MNSKEIKKIFEIEDVLSLPMAITSLLFESSIEKRDSVYKELLEVNKGDLSHDWFQEIYEGELAQRNQNKQDFTPNVIGILLSKLTGVEEGCIYEPTAGNGSLLIANWWYRVSNLGENYLPSRHPVVCWELSDRSIPILLLNLSIRGIIGEVHHGDVIEQKIKTKYTLEVNNTCFSEIIRH
jgi:Type I restriction-modification system methyltransferase subunit